MDMCPVSDAASHHPDIDEVGAFFGRILRDRPCFIDVKFFKL